MNEIRVIPLGTISPYPKGNMNCPGFLVEYKEYKFLLDCGNGITRLLNLPEDLNNLNVFVSHYHKDHFADIGALQYASFVHHNLGNLDNKINIYLPENDFDYNKKAIISNAESYANYFNINEKEKYVFEDLAISFEDNKSHTIESYMIKLENEYFKIVYTSDIGTTNWDNLINFCQNSDIIICESSFLLKHNSSSKTHLTAYDAGRLANLANAKKLLLTHFWPDIDKEEYLEEAKQQFENTQVAEEEQTLILRR